MTAPARSRSLVRGSIRVGAPHPPRGTGAADAPMFTVGLDLGQSVDYTSLIVVETTERDDDDPLHDVRAIERLPLGTRYPAIVAHACDVVAALRGHEPRPAVSLVVDYTGVGRPVADMLVDARPDADLVLVTITGGDAVVWGDDGTVRVPKRNLASTVQVLLQTGRLRIAAGLPMAAALTEELAGFRVTIGLNGHDSYAAGEDWRSAPHDDLVLALALACWHAERPVAYVGIG